MKFMHIKAVYVLKTLICATYIISNSYNNKKFITMLGDNSKMIQCIALNLLESVINSKCRTNRQFSLDYNVYNIYSLNLISNFNL